MSTAGRAAVAAALALTGVMGFAAPAFAVPAPPADRCDDGIVIIADAGGDRSNTDRSGLVVDLAGGDCQSGESHGFLQVIIRPANNWSFTR